MSMTVPIGMCKGPTHETSGEGLVGSDLSIDLDESLLDNSSNFSAGKSVLQSVSKEDGEGKGLSELVRSGRRSGGLPQSVSSFIHVLAGV